MRFSLGRKKKNSASQNHLFRQSPINESYPWNTGARHYDDHRSMGATARSAAHNSFEAERDGHAMRCFSHVVQAIHIVNESYYAPFRSCLRSGKDFCCGEVDTVYPETIDSADRLALLDMCCRHDTGTALDALMLARAMPDIEKLYSAEYAKCPKTRTPAKEIPLDVDPLNFYALEAQDACNANLCIDWYADSYADALKPFDDPKFYITATYSNIAVYERETGRRFFGCMDPPWGTKTLYYSMAELETALRRVLSDARAINLSMGCSQCPVCGKPISECGPIGIWPVLEDGTVYLRTENKSKFPNPSIHMCMNCASTWMHYEDKHQIEPVLELQMFMGDRQKQKALLSSVEPAIRNAVHGAPCRPWINCDTVPDPRAAITYFTELEQFRDAQKRNQDFETAWSERWQKEYAARRRARRAFLLPGVWDTPLTDEDEATVAFALESQDLKHALAILGAWFKKAIIPLQNEIRLRTAITEKTWDIVSSIFQDYAAKHIDMIKELIRDANANRKAAIRYAKAVRRVLDAFPDDELPKTLLDFPIRCNFVLTGRNEFKHKISVTCSLEEMAAFIRCSGLLDWFGPDADWRQDT